MRRQKVKAAVFIGAVAALAAALGPAAAEGQPGGSDTVVVDCSGRPQVRPSSYLIACGDGNNGLVSLHWTQWGPASAAARGLDRVNDCVPYCAAGRFHSYPVTVRLDTVRPRPGQQGRPHYTVLHVHYMADTPAQTPRDAEYPILEGR
ncbi:hypothetical protein N4G70_06420 [Streptomyces sp. ASQP_92]|uniref:hypothetical protein n=1 Tax=Streptomyces sp. ASQP_92 TaxID=2979116 RepID=UPI0021BFA9FA|nr:hypothetical protein [Streptomyces sp. ASQP_92]MCT9088502.1 hypothetical protein [Streptomyces sp. ASQP_92]